MSSAHDTRLEIGGDVYWVRRTFDLIRRIEQSFGPLAELDTRLRKASLPVDDIARLYGIVLRDQASRPEPDAVAEHIAEAGIMEACTELDILVGSLFAGHRKTIEWMQAEVERARAAVDAVAGPREPAASTGTPISMQPASSIGAPSSSGAPPSTTSRLPSGHASGAPSRSAVN